MAIVEAVCISEKKGEPKRRVGGALFKAGHGIVGDAHAGEWHRQVSLLSSSAVDRVLNTGHLIQPGDFAENLLVRGLDFNKICIGTLLKAGGVVLEITQIGKECHNNCAIHKRIGMCIMPKEGIFARVLQNGVVREGDPVEIRIKRSQNWSRSMKKNEFLNILRKRRSIRRFEEKALSAEDIRLLQESCLRAPSSRNLNPWEFIFVTDKKILNELAEVKEYGASFLKDAALGVVFCGDENVSDTWIEDCSIAAILLQLSAQELGLGSCWVQVRKRKNHADESSEAVARRVLKLDEEIRVLNIVAIGYPDEAKTPVPVDKLDWDKIKLI